MEEKQQIQKKPQFIINLDTTPIYFTDYIQMKTNKAGVVLDFCQQVFNNDQFKVVGRIGMNRDHAKDLLKQLGNLIAMTEGQLQTNKSKN